MTVNYFHTVPSQNLSLFQLICHWYNENCSVFHCQISSHGGREKSTEKHQPISEGISWEPRILSSHTGPQNIAKEISFHLTTNDMMVAEQV